jgi:CBS domain-containing protein
MQRIAEVMTRDVRTVTPQDNLQQTARLMADLDVGALPVCEDGRLLGMVTDRDITIRATAEGMSAQDTRVERIMTREVNWCFEDEALDDVMSKMAGSQIRRIPVVSRENRLVGIIALGDLVTRTQGSEETEVQEVVEMVSTPNGGQGGRQGMSMQSGQGGGQGGAGQQSGSQQSGSQQSGSQQSGSQQSGSQQSGSQQSGSRQAGYGGSRSGAEQYGQGMDGPLATGDGTGGHIGPDTESGT